MCSALESSFRDSGIARDSLLLSHVLCPLPVTVLCAAPTGVSDGMFPLPPRTAK